MGLRLGRTVPGDFIVNSSPPLSGMVLLLGQYRHSPFEEKQQFLYRHIPHIISQALLSRYRQLFL
jgi:hypothetical protein